MPEKSQSPIVCFMSFVMAAKVLSLVCPPPTVAMIMAAVKLPEARVRLVGSMSHTVYLYYQSRASVRNRHHNSHVCSCWPRECQSLTLLEMLRLHVFERSMFWFFVLF